MSDSPPESASSPPRWLERGLEHLQDLGLSPSLLERFTSWWRRYGLLKTALLTAAVLWPVLRFEVLPGATSALLESLAEAEGVQLEVEDWSLSLTDFSASAHGVEIKSGAGYARPFLLKADTIVVDASLWQNVWEGIGRLGRRADNVLRLVTFRDRRPLPPRPVGRSITVNVAELHLERLISGRYNWRDAVVGTVAPGVETAAADAYFVPVVTVTNLKVTHVEHLPAPVGTGLEQSLTSTLHIDEATLRVADFVGPNDGRADPTDVSLDGRVADGRVSVTGSFNLWTPSFAVDIALTNVGAATMGLLSPEAALVPTSGTLTGHIAVAMQGDELRQCAVNVTFQDVRYRPNPRSPIIAPRPRQLEPDLRDLVLSETVVTPCTGRWSDPSFRPHHAVQASMTAEALRDGPAAVQALARLDQRRFAEALSPQAVQQELARSADALSQEAGRQIGEQTGNAVSRGLKSVGRGVGRLFGRKPR